jgi:hypothetical protein
MKKLITLIALALPLLAAAQQVWRCGPEGRSYSDTPCPAGKALEPVQARPAADLEAAQARAERELQLADRLHRERLSQEAAARGNGLAAIGPRSQLKPALPVRHRLAKKHRSAAEDDGTWRATAPASRQTKG